MVKMKNMLFPLLMIMGIGSAPTMQALSGAERAKIKLQLDKAFTANKFSQVKQLIEALRRGGEERIADEFELKLNDRLHVLLNNLGESVNDIWNVWNKVYAAGNVPNADPGGGNADGHRKFLVKQYLNDLGSRLHAQAQNLMQYLRKPEARNSLILDLWAPAVQTIINAEALYTYLAPAITKVNDRRVVREMAAIVDQEAALAAFRNALADAINHDDHGLKGTIGAADLAARRTKAAATLVSLVATDAAIGAAKRAIDAEVGDAGIQP